MKYNRKKDVLVKELNNLICRLVKDIDMYYDNNLVLNSEGRKMFSKLTKILLYLYPELKPSIVKTRRELDYESVLRVIMKIRETYTGEDALCT